MAFTSTLSSSLSRHDCQLTYDDCAKSDKPFKHCSLCHLLKSPKGRRLRYVLKPWINKKKNVFGGSLCNGMKVKIYPPFWATRKVKISIWNKGTLYRINFFSIKKNLKKITTKNGVKFLYIWTKMFIFIMPGIEMPTL